LYGGRDFASLGEEAVKGLSKKQLLKEHQELRAENARLRQEVQLLHQKMDLLIRRVFGRSSEKLDGSQLDLFLLAAENEPGKVDASSLEEADPRHEVKARRNARPRERWPGELPVIEEIIDPKEVQQAPEAWRLIGAEISEQLDYEPGRFLRRRLIRRKYVRRGDPEAVPVIAALPPSLQERCIAAPGLLAQIIVSKYCDHLPLYRQEAIFGNRYGVHLPRQNMARWMGLAADWLRPIYEKIRSGVMAGGYLQIDETPIRYLSPGHGQTKLGYFWTALSPGGDVLYHWETSRAADCLSKVIAADFQGTLQCDAYVAYGSFVKNHARKISLAGCWAHARRNFYEAREQAPQRCGWILRQIAHLYRIEENLRRSAAGPRKRAAERMSQSRPICERLHRALVLFKKSRRYLPRSAFGQAIDYALSNWPLLTVYLEDGRIQIDNNLVENCIRPTALGKKNWLFFGDADAGQRSAILYTIIESCRCRGIDPHAYLRDVLTRLPSMTNWQVKDITPEAWAKTSRCSAAATAA
jgi:transposase